MGIADFIKKRESISAQEEISLQPSKRSYIDKRDNFVGAFDLNIEKILGGWEVYHAIREIIANALDEQIVTQTEEISIRRWLLAYCRLWTWIELSPSNTK